METINIQNSVLPNKTTTFYYSLRPCGYLQLALGAWWPSLYAGERPGRLFLTPRWCHEISHGGILAAATNQEPFFQRAGCETFLRRSLDEAQQSVSDHALWGILMQPGFEHLGLRRPFLPISNHPVLSFGHYPVQFSVIHTHEA